MHAGSLLLAVTLTSLACRQQERPHKVLLDTTMPAPASDVTCTPQHYETNGQAFVVVKLDSAAARAGRLQLNFVKQDSTIPIDTRLQASTGAAACHGARNGVEFIVRGEQTYLALLLRAGTTFAAVNVKRLEKNEMLNARAYATDDSAQEIVWGDRARTP